MQLPISLLAITQLTLGLRFEDTPSYIQKRILEVLAEFYLIHGEKYEILKSDHILPEYQISTSAFIFSQLNKNISRDLHNFKFYFNELNELAEIFTQFENSPNPLNVNDALFLISINSVFVVVDLRSSQPVCYCPHIDEIIPCEEFFHERLFALLSEQQNDPFEFNKSIIEVKIQFQKDQSFSQESFESLLKFSNIWSQKKSTSRLFEEFIEHNNFKQLSYFIDLYENDFLNQIIFNILKNLSIDSFHLFINSTNTAPSTTLENLSIILIELTTPTELIKIALNQNAHQLLSILLKKHRTTIKETFIELKEELLEKLPAEINNKTSFIIFEFFLSLDKLDIKSNFSFFHRCYQKDPVSLLTLITNNPDFFEFFTFLTSFDSFLEHFSTKNIYDLIKNNYYLNEERIFKYLFQKLNDNLDSYYTYKAIDSLIKNEIYLKETSFYYPLIRQNFSLILFANDLLTLTSDLNPNNLFNSSHPYCCLAALNTITQTTSEQVYFNSRTIENFFKKLMNSNLQPPKDIILEIKSILIKLNSPKLIFLLIREAYSYPQSLISSDWLNILEDCFKKLDIARNFPTYPQNNFMNCLVENHSRHPSKFTFEESNKNNSLILGVCLGMSLCYLHAYHYQEMKYFFDLLFHTQNSKKFNEFKRKFISLTQNKEVASNASELEEVFTIKSYLDNVLYLQDWHLYNNEFDLSQGLYPGLFNDSGITALASTLGIYTKDELINMFSPSLLYSAFTPGCSYLIYTPCHAMSLICNDDYSFYLFDPNTGIVSSPISIVEILNQNDFHHQVTTDLRPLIFLGITLVSKKDLAIDQRTIDAIEKLKTHQEFWFLDYQNNPILSVSFFNSLTNTSTLFVDEMYTLPGRNLPLEFICKNILTIKSYLVNNQYLWSGLEKCILYDNFFAFKEILSFYPHVINQTCRSSETLLIKAIKHGKLNFIEFLLSFDSINLTSFCELGLNALSHAAHSYDLSLLLLSHASEQELVDLILKSKTKDNPIINQIVQMIHPRVHPYLSILNNFSNLGLFFSKIRPFKTFSYYLKNIIEEYHIDNIELSLYADDLSFSDLSSNILASAQTLSYPLTQYFYADLISALINISKFDLLDFLMQQENIELLDRTQYLIEKSSGNSWHLYVLKNIEFANKDLILKSINEYPLSMVLPFLENLKSICIEKDFNLFLIELIKRAFDENLSLKAEDILNLMKKEDYDWAERWLDLLKENQLHYWTDLDDMLLEESLQESSNLLISIKSIPSNSEIVPNMTDSSTPEKIKPVLFSDVTIGPFDFQMRPEFL